MPLKTRTDMRRRVFWIALPIAVVLALWMGPGLDASDELPTRPLAPTIEPQTDREPAPPSPLPECEAPPDPGPDGDR